MIAERQDRCLPAISAAEMLDAALMTIVTISVISIISISISMISISTIIIMQCRDMPRYAAAYSAYNDRFCTKTESVNRGRSAPFAVSHHVFCVVGLLQNLGAVLRR